MAKQTLLEIGDGPEGIHIYTDEDRGVVDWAETFPPVYIDISMWRVNAHFGPFTLRSIHEQLVNRLSP